MRRRILKRLAETLKTLDKLLCNYVAAISDYIPRSAVVLFGSRARGDHKPYSDFDLMVIVEEGYAAQALELATRLKPRALPVDLIVLQVDEIKEPLKAKMLRDGCIILYDNLDLPLLGSYCKIMVCH